jgi:hypothetical protein
MVSRSHPLYLSLYRKTQAGAKNDGAEKKFACDFGFMNLNSFELIKDFCDFEGISAVVETMSIRHNRVKEISEGLVALFIGMESD